MKNTLIYIAITLFSFGCELSNSKQNNSSSTRVKEFNRDFLVPISDFKMDAEALQDGDDIEVLCASESLFPSDVVDFYVHAIVVSQKTSDTINVLTTGFLDVPGDRITQFYSPMTETALIFQNLEDLEELENKNVKDLKPKKYKTVYVDPEFIQLEYSNYPSTIGMIGKMEISQMDESEN